MRMGCVSSIEREEYGSGSRVKTYGTDQSPARKRRIEKPRAGAWGSDVAAHARTLSLGVQRNRTARRVASFAMEIDWA